MKGETGQRLRSSIQASIEKAEEERRQELFKHRIELARQGLRAFQRHQIKEAIQCFHTYIKILEEWKKVPEGGLNPTLFDLKEDAAELLLISGIYWDLAKVYDRAKGDQQKKDFKHYLDKYIVFSKGMAYQALCAETMRKYIRNEKPVHLDEFKTAYKRIGTSGCFIATSLIDVCEINTLPRLRAYRDERLEKTFAGRLFTKVYYQVAPIIAFVLDRMPDSIRRVSARVIDRIADRVN